MRKTSEAQRSLNKIDEITKQLKEIKIIEASLNSDLKAEILRHNLLTSQRVADNRGRVIDRSGEKIEIGDTVRFLSRGGNHSQRGVVTRFTRFFVIAEDSSGQEVRRKASNLQVIAKVVEGADSSSSGEQQEEDEHE